MADQNLNDETTAPELKQGETQISEVMQVELFNLISEVSLDMNSFLASMDPSKIVSIEAAAGPAGIFVEGEINSSHYCTVVYRQNIDELDYLVKSQAKSRHGGVFGGENSF